MVLSEYTYHCWNLNHMKVVEIEMTVLTTAEIGCVSLSSCSGGKQWLPSTCMVRTEWLIYWRPMRGSISIDKSEILLTNPPKTTEETLIWFFLHWGMNTRGTRVGCVRDLLKTTNVQCVLAVRWHFYTCWFRQTLYRSLMLNESDETGLSGSLT